MNFLEILKYTLPSIIVFLTAYLFIRAFLEKEERSRKLDITLNNQKLLTPIKLQAYERLVLLLERMSPELIVMRVQTPGMTARELQAELLNTIRAEYEHNLSQQIYISTQAWEMVKTSKESTVKLINSAAARLNDQAKSIDLAKLIIEMYISVEVTPASRAIEFLKAEIQQVII